MKRGFRRLVAIGMAIGLSVASCLTAFAAEDTNRLKLFGQELQVYADYDEFGEKNYVAIVDGTDTINISDFATVDPSKNLQTLLGEINYNIQLKPFELKTADLSDIDSIVTKGITEYYFTSYVIEYGNDFDIFGYVYVLKMPYGYTTESLGDLSKYVIYANGSTNSTQSTGQWVQNSTGWWYDNGDGTYPSNTWKEINSKHYYFDGNGYMLHDTTTPDGYQVGSDGAWIQ